MSQSIGNDHRHGYHHGYLHGYHHDHHDHHHIDHHHYHHDHHDHHHMIIIIIIMIITMIMIIIMIHQKCHGYAMFQIRKKMKQDQKIFGSVEALDFKEYCQAKVQRIQVLKRSKDHCQANVQSPSQVQSKSQVQRRTPFTVHHTYPIKVVAKYAELIFS